MKTILISISILLFAGIGYASPTDRSEIERRLEIADSLHSAGQTDSAASFGEKTIQMARESDDPVLMVGAYAAQGVFLRSLGRINEALECYDNGLHIATSGKFRNNPSQEAIEQIASLYINLSVLNLDMQNKEDAVKNAESAGNWIASSNDPDLKSIIYGAVGSVMTGCSELGKALEYQKLAYENAMEAGNTDAAFRSAAYTMLAADRLGEKDTAQAEREKCRRLLPDIESIMSKLLYFQAECSICMKGDDHKGAVGWFEKILELPGIDNLPFVKFDCYNNLHVSQATLGNYREAYATLLKSNELRDSLWEKEKAENLRELTVKYETQETKLALAESEAKKSRVIMWLFIALGALLAGVIIFIIYAGRQRRRRLQQEIEFANLREDIGRRLTQQYVEGLENERARMARELHDGVCNDLLAIGMNISNGGSQERTAQLISTCRESVRRISHELMPPEFSYATIDEVVRFFIRKQQEANDGKIIFNYTSSSDTNSWEEIPDAVALELYRIVQEAVGNAVRHSGAGRIDVSLDLKENGITMKMTDNGIFKTSGRKGAGMESMNRRAKSINGHLETRASENGGTSVILNVRI